jgi:hypothetical protein
VLDESLKGERTVEAGRVRKQPNSGRPEGADLVTPFQIAQSRHHLVGGLAEERDRLRIIVRDLVLTAQFLLTNFMNNTVQTPIDFPAASPAEAA